MLSMEGTLRKVALSFLLACSLTACTESSLFVEGQSDAGALDAGAQDAGALDAGAQDAGAQDAGLSSTITGKPNEILGQTVTIPYGGNLRSVEVEIAAPAGEGPSSLVYQADPAVIGYQTWGFASTSSQNPGSWFDAQANATVSAGEQVEIWFYGQDVTATVRAGDGDDGGTLLINGVPDPLGRDLNFVFAIDASNTLGAPDPIARAGIGGTFIAWSAQPGAASYTVQRSSESGALASLGPTLNPWVFDPMVDVAVGTSVNYQVVATAADGGAAASSTRSVVRDSRHLVADCFAGAPLVFTSGALTQSFTVASGGTLDEIELPSGTSDQLTLTLYGADGGALGSRSVSTSVPFQEPLASPYVDDGVAFSFAGAGIALSPGDNLSFQVTLGSGSPGVVLRSDDRGACSGPALSLNGTQGAGSLSFKTIAR